jgi:hypothetical protein
MRLSNQLFPKSLGGDELEVDEGNDGNMHRVAWCKVHRAAVEAACVETAKAECYTDAIEVLAKHLLDLCVPYAFRRACRKEMNRAVKVALDSEYDALLVQFAQ